MFRVVQKLLAEWNQHLKKMGELYTFAAMSKAGLPDVYYAGILTLFNAPAGGSVVENLKEQFGGRT